MIEKEYAIAYCEILEILKYIPKEDYNKIPQSIIEGFKDNSNEECSFHYDPNKTLQEQNVSDIAKGIIIILFRDYWADERQRKMIIAKQRNDKMKIIEKERAIEETEDLNIFIHTNENEDKAELPKEQNNEKETALINTKDNLFTKIKRFVLKLVHMKNNRD